jgi:hypothetical protein
MFKIGEHIDQIIKEATLNPFPRTAEEYLNLTPRVYLTKSYSYYLDDDGVLYVEFIENRNAFEIVHFDELQELLDDPEFHIKYNQTHIPAIPPEIPQ